MLIVSYTAIELHWRSEETISSTFLLGYSDKDMRIFIEIQMILLLVSLYSTGNMAEALTYDYSASIECLVEPLNPQYEGGMLINPKFDKDLQGWNVYGQGEIEVRTSPKGNKFIVAHNRTEVSDSFGQLLFLDAGKLYTFSAWVQVSEGSDTVLAVFRTNQQEHIDIVAGSVTARSGCWSMLKGGLTATSSGQAELYFTNTNQNIEIWADSISMQPFTRDQWRVQQSESIEKIRKRNVRIHVVDQEGKKIEGAVVSIEQTRPNFPLGCGIADTILTNKDYQDWFTARFTATTFDNEMKWYSTERMRGEENYSVPDAMLAFAKQHRISVRGHNIFWDSEKYQPEWVKSLTPEELRVAIIKRMDSVVSRYAGQVIAWDVMNENVHFSYFETLLGPNTSAAIFQRAQQLDPETTMFMNDYNTLEQVLDLNATPSKYLEKLDEIRSFPGNGRLLAGIGLESHFGEPNIPYMRACLDIFSATKLPIWLTELDVVRGPNQAKFLEEIMREGYSHPGIQGIIVWGGWRPTGCSNMCLTDNNFNNLPAGDVVDKLIEEWKTLNLSWTTGDDDYYEYHVYHGEYKITVVNPNTNSSWTYNFEVKSGSSETLDLWFYVR